MTTHLLAAISPHGYGHTAQTAAVVNALRQRLPHLKLTLRTTVPASFLSTRFNDDFELDPSADDFGMQMASAIDVLVNESAQNFIRLHQDWDRNVDALAERFTAQRPDLILADVPYLTLAAAERAAIPAVALCSLNWADIYLHYCGDRPEAAAIHGQMLAAYNSARCFLQTEPSMPMPGLRNSRRIGPVARIGIGRRREIINILALPPTTRLVMVNMGGITMRLPMEEWPETDGLCWIVEPAWAVRHPNAVSLDKIGLPFIDILASCDVIIGKPGYGLIVESACNAVPMLYVRRGDWPEEPFLIAWLERHGRSREIDREALHRGELVGPLSELWGLAPKPAVAPTGAAEASEILARILLRQKIDLPLA